MAMGWLKGLVAPTAFGDNAQQAPLPGMAPGGPPMGGMPPQGGAPYGAPQGGAPYGGSPYGGSAEPPPYDASALPNAMQWSTGTRSQGAPGVAGGISGGAGGNVVSPAAETVLGGTSLEARCAQLQHDVDSLALFARTLLTILEESKVVTRAQFDATKNRLDMLDGKLDDR
jgi:hypothetical protein